jgi:hypothetical protein
MGRPRTFVGLAATLAGVLAAATAAQSNGAPDGTILALASHSGQTQYRVQFAVDGKSIRGLYPGAVKKIELRISNPYGFDLVLQRVEGRLVATSRRRCSPDPSHLEVRKYLGKLPVTLRAHSRTTVGTLPVAMPKDAPAKCADTKFTIAISGTAKRTGR